MDFEEFKDGSMSAKSLWQVRSDDIQKAQHDDFD
jgi:hypothetical protein